MIDPFAQLLGLCALGAVLCALAYGFLALAWGLAESLIFDERN